MNVSSMEVKAGAGAFGRVWEMEDVMLDVIVVVGVVVVFAAIDALAKAVDRL